MKIQELIKTVTDEHNLCYSGQFVSTTAGNKPFVSLSYQIEPEYYQAFNLVLFKRALQKIAITGHNISDVATGYIVPNFDTDEIPSNNYRVQIRYIRTN